MTLCTPNHLIPTAMSHRNDIHDSTDPKQGKLRYVGSKTRKFENWETGFALFLNVPEVRWTPELFQPVLWVSTDWNKLLRQKNEKVLALNQIPQFWKCWFSQILYGNQCARGVGRRFLTEGRSERIFWGASVIDWTILYDAGVSDGVSATIFGLKNLPHA